MKIALVSPYDISHPSGVNAHVRELSRELQSRGHDTKIFAPGSTKHRDDDGVVVVGRTVPVRVGDSIARIALSPFLASRVQQELDDGAFDVVHIHEPLVPMLTLEFLRRSSAATIGTFHASHEGGSLGYSLMRHVLRHFGRRLDARIAVSPAAERLVLRYFPAQYEIIPNGVDTTRFAARMPVPPELEQLQPYVLFVGRFEERKGLPILLHAFRDLRRRRPDVQLVVVGGGPARAEYEALIAKHGVDGVHFVGRVPDEALPAYYQHAAVFCAPNTGNESFGIVLLEAMAAGCPVVASNIAGFAELIVYGAHGLLVPPHHPHFLTDALRRVLDDRKLQGTLSAGGVGYAEQFAWPVVADQVLDLYERALAARRRD